MSKLRSPAGLLARRFLLLCAVGGAWFGGFLLVSNSYAPGPRREESEVTKSVRQHFTSLAAVQRRLFDVDNYFGGNHIPGMLDAIVQFTKPSPPAPNTITLDGFLAKHIDVCQDKNGVCSIVAVFSRRPPFDWPRALDLCLGRGIYERIDLVDNLTSTEFGYYRIDTPLRLQMESPHGQFIWAVNKDIDLMMSKRCLFRQDLYKDGEWIRSLMALAK